MPEMITYPSETDRTVSINPATGDIIGSTREHSVEELHDAVRRARAAQEPWARKPYRERARYVLAIRDHIVENADEIAAIISKDNGKTRIDALTTEVLPSAMSANYNAKNAQKLLKRKRLKPGCRLLMNKRSYIDRVPYGVVGIISPWNYPFAIPFHDTVSALMAGNAVVLKVATQTLEVGKLLKETILAGGLPDGLFSLVNIPGAKAGDAFIESGIDKLLFTGSVAVGKKLMAKAAERLIPVTLELSGNDAMIVCRDANLLRAAGGAVWAGYSNAGQSCAGVERIYVEKDVYKEFIRLFRKMVEDLRLGQDADFDVDVGAMTTKKQLETVTEHVRDALEKGAVITAVSKWSKDKHAGNFYPPTVLENVNDSMLIMRNETFGPAIAVMQVESLEEAVRRANNSNLGLTASVWTRNRKKAHAVAAQLEVGSVTINDHLMSHGLPETPWGGFKQSGIGRSHGALGLEEMTQPRTVVDDILPGVQRNFWWYPHNRAIYTGVRGLLDALYSKSLFQRFSGMMKLAVVLPRTFRK